MTPELPASTEEALRASPSLAAWWHLARSFQAIGSRIGRFLEEEEGVTGAQLGVQAVVAPSYARIFYRNAVDGGFFVPFESLDDLSQTAGLGHPVTPPCP